MSDTMLMMAVALGAEVLLLLLVVMGVVIVRGTSAKRRDRDAMRALIARIKKEKPEREKAIEQFLAQRMSLEGEALDQSRVAMLRAEMALLQRFIGVYRDRDASRAGRFDTDVVAAFAPYHALSGLPGAADAPQVAPEADGTEVERLRKEIARLEDELRITMETMSRMLNEYSTVFSGGTPDNAAPIGAVVSAPLVAPGTADDVDSTDGDSLFDELADAVSAIGMADDESDEVMFDPGNEEAPVEGLDEPFVAGQDDLAVVLEEPEVLVTENDVQAGTDSPEGVADEAPGGVTDPESSAQHDDEKDITLTDDLFDAVQDNEVVAAEAADMAPTAPPADEPVELLETPAPESAPSTVPDELGADAQGSPPDEDDPIAQILREAESQERSARGVVVGAVDSQPAEVVVDDIDAILASAGTLEEGEVEIMAGADDALSGEDKDVLFDAVELDVVEEKPVPLTAGGADELFDVARDDSNSGSAN